MQKKIVLLSLCKSKMTTKFFDVVLVWSTLCWFQAVASESTRVTVTGLSLCGNWNESRVYVTIEAESFDPTNTEWQYCNETSCASLSFGSVSWNAIVDDVHFGLWLADGTHFGSEQMSIFDTAAGHSTYDGHVYAAELQLNSTRANDYGCANTLHIRFRFDVDDEENDRNRLTTWQWCLVSICFLLSGVSCVTLFAFKTHWFYRCIVVCCCIDTRPAARRLKSSS